MPNYQEGKIYAIRSNHTEKVYIGSTCSDINKRFYEHKYISKGCQAQEIFKFDDAYIDLLEKFSCNSRKELVSREAYHVRNNNSVNIRIDDRSRKEWYDDGGKNNQKKAFNTWYNSDKGKEYYKNKKKAIII